MPPDETSASVDWLCIGPTTPLLELLERQEGATARGLPAGILLVVDADGRIRGTVTDGDIRRALIEHRDLGLTAADLLRPDPIRFPDHYSFRDILRHLPGELDRRGRRSRRFLGKIVLVDAEDRPTHVIDYHQLWEQRVASHRHIAVVGLGYVGLTLAVELAHRGLQVSGVDVDQRRVEALRAGRSHVHEPGLDELLREQLEANLQIQTAVPEGCDVFIVAVGTPLSAGDHAADLDPLRDAVSAVGERLRPGGLVVLRSTVPVGTTRSIVRPLLEEQSGLRAGRGFHLAFAPERTAEGSALIELTTLPQLIGGYDVDSLEAAGALFRELTPAIVRLESLEAAELAKLINNAFRDLSFAFANEVSRLTAPLNLDVVEVIRAANHGYPRDRVPVPSPGVGGPCLSKDPYILSTLSSRPKGTLFAAGREVNEAMPAFVAGRVLAELDGSGRSAAESRVAVCGLAFKGEPETNDLRQSPALAIAQQIAATGARVVAHDPVVDDGALRAQQLEPAALEVAVGGADAVLFLNNHRSFESIDIFSLVRAMRQPAIVYDGWHLFRPDDVLRSASAVYLAPGLRRGSDEARSDR